MTGKSRQALAAVNLVLCLKKCIMRKQVKAHQQFRFLIIIAIQFFGINVAAQPVQPLPGNHLILPEDDYEVPFKWIGDSVNAKWEPFAAMLLPVKLSGCTRTFYMQFDLGAPYSVIYGPKLKAINSKYRLMPALADTALTVNDLVFMIGTKKLTARKMIVKNHGIAKLNPGKKSVDIIGTIGTDLLTDKTLIIDYPGQKMTISDQVPGRLLSRITLTDFMFVRNSILLPVTIKEKKNAPVLRYRLQCLRTHQQ
jgi:hypothetical protein